MRDRFPVALGLGVLLAGLLGLWLMRTAARSDFADHLSTYAAAPGGSRALFLLAEEAGLPARREKHDLLVIDEDTVPVVLGVSPREAAAVSRHADAGTGGGDDQDDTAKAPAADEAEDDTDPEGLADLFEEHGLSEDEIRELLAHVRRGGTLVYVPWRAEDNPLLAALHLRLEPADRHQPPRTLVPAQPNPYTRGVSTALTRVAAYLSLPDSAVPLLVDERTLDPVAALVTFGQGQVIVLSAPELAENRALARADNAQLWLSLLGAASRGRPLAFDEHHHGFTTHRSIAEFAARYGLQFAVLQLLFGLCLWSASLRRFGAARAPEEERRALGAEALLASSRLYRAGKHRAFAAGMIVGRLGEELAALAAVSPRATPAELVAGLEQRNRRDLAAAFAELRALADRCDSDAGVQRVATLAASLRRLAFPVEPSPASAP